MISTSGPLSISDVSDRCASGRGYRDFIENFIIQFLPRLLWKGSIVAGVVVHSPTKNLAAPVQDQVTL